MIFHLCRLSTPLIINSRPQLVEGRALYYSDLSLLMQQITGSIMVIRKWLIHYTMKKDKRPLINLCLNDGIMIICSNVRAGRTLLLGNQEFPNSDYSQNQPRKKFSQNFIRFTTKIRFHPLLFVLFLLHGYLFLFVSSKIHFRRLQSCIKH